MKIEITKREDRYWDVVADGRREVLAPDEALYAVAVLLVDWQAGLNRLLSEEDFAAREKRYSDRSAAETTVAEFQPTDIPY